MFMIKSVVLVAILTPLMLTGCGPAHMKTIRAAKRQVIGQDVAFLSRCVGEPLAVRAIEGEDLIVHHYSSAQARGADGRLLATPVPDPRADAKACVFDVAVLNGRIIAIESENRAGWGFGSITNCSAVVERCVKL